jgi:hypothetical protein
VTFAAIESAGLEEWLAGIRKDLFDPIMWRPQADHGEKREPTGFVAGLNPPSIHLPD